jgi:hypothetical protein
MSFQNLKKQSSLGSLTAKLVQQVEKMNKGSGGVDDRLWKPEVDKAGNGYAVIRFLPAPEGEELPWAKVYSHAFQGPGGWFIENSLTTLGQKDPVSEYNSQLWNSGLDSDKEVARKQKRKLSYYANIYVVKDPNNSANEGDKITAAMQPEFEDETPINPFDFWGGANFKLKIKKVAGYWNYDSSEFDRPSPLLDDDDALEAVWKQEYSLSELLAPDQFKSYEDLKKRLDYVLGTRGVPKYQDPEVMDEESDNDSYSVDPTPRRSVEPVAVAAGVDRDEDEEDALSYFARLAED